MQDTKQKKSKKIILIITAVIITLSVIWILFLPKKGTDDFSQTVTVTKEIIKDVIQISGYIQPAQQQNLQSPGEGLIKKVAVKEGDIVKKGDLIFALDNTYQAFQVAKQEFAIEKEKLLGYSKNLELMKLELESLKRALRDRSVYAKFDGIVVSFDLTEGSYVMPKDNFGVIIDRSFFKSTVDVSERDVPRLKIGQKVLLNFQALGEEEVEGRVTYHSSIAKSSVQRGATVIETKIVVDKLPENVLPGYSFSGKIVAGEDEEVLLLDQTALLYDKGEPYVEKLLENGKVERVNVEVESYAQGTVKVLSGLKEGDTLKVRPPKW
ncbi:MULTISPECIES: efflux RND transporter periplasmic adaptor subunit [unclassified Treponema]|uniref:efflux RND transporter periplasmic adaptor subunit n=1 Tax=unclassified Treponema TaxID=2638727 RepID=UPI0020A4FB36|nr:MULTISPECIES: efflux RND transporter periplasmic adaptor subunit [unclassified Treponema]UTC66062.1 efflux RND transporter periplasmic adaptor subunit [Treponema sp. OMZ 789]UTC68792.1 efflux RND transporter periplasmic adaptor subunit [Treponema sp. OMZ 790]UTC71521.1 efflux RND transporter periplasmic adaptor subunit [Treponema sp. OMZ 791]